MAKSAEPSPGQPDETGITHPVTRPAGTKKGAPDKTLQELETGWGERAHDPDSTADDERLLRERPPHWE